MIAVLAVVTLALTAFDGQSGGTPVVSKPAPLPVTSTPPEPHVLATVGNLRVQSPVAEGGVTARASIALDRDETPWVVYMHQPEGSTNVTEIQTVRAATFTPPAPS